MAPQDSQNCGRDFAKRKQTDADFAANSLLRMVIIDIESNTILGRVTLHPAGMHCPSWDDAFVSSCTYSRRALYGLPQTLHGDRACRDYQKGVIHYSIQRKVFPTGCTEKFGLIDRRAVSQQ